MSFFSWCQIVRFIMLVTNCPGAKLSGAKLSWCQIIRVPNCPLLLFWCQIVCFYYLGAKLSVFIILVPNCLFLLSWCQVVRFIILVPNCPVPNCLVPNCPPYYLGAKLSGAKLSGAKLSYNRCLDCRNILNAWTVGEFFFWG